MKAIKYVLSAMMMISSVSKTDGKISLPDAGQNTGDPDTVILKAKDAQQYRITVAAQSDDLNWIALRKWYYKNSDTILIMNRNRVQQPQMILQKMSAVHFIDQDKLLASGDGQAVFQNLKSGTNQIYQNVLQVSTVKMPGKKAMYAVLSTDQRLEVYDDQGRLFQKENSVKSFQTIENFGFVIHHKENKNSEISIISPLGVKRLYHTVSEIKNVSLSIDQQYIIVSETVQSSPSLQEGTQEEFTWTMKVINAKTGKVSILPFDLPGDFKAFDELSMAKIGRSESYLFTLRKKMKPENNMLEIWYGIESDIQSVYNGKTSRIFYVWNAVDGTIQLLKSEPDEMYVAFTHNRYLLKYHRNKGHNYVDWKPSIQIRLYDLLSEKESALGTFAGVDYKSSEVVYSTDGKYMAGSEDRKKWFLWNLETMEKTNIDRADLQYPTFTKDGKAIYFGSPEGLWTFDLKTEKLQHLNVGFNKETSIMNAEKIQQLNDSYFASYELDLSKPVLIRNYDRTNNLTAFHLLKKGVVSPLIPSTTDKLKNAVWNNAADEFLFLEENFNQPTKLYHQHFRKPKKLVYQSNLNDRIAPLLKQELIEYRNAHGDLLKGTLYYPLHYNPDRQYPMVVRIYQVQRHEASEYMIRGNASYVTYDKRGLLERGYFVYEPDIVYGNEGTGRGVLDCVNHAMDAVLKNKSINRRKIALLGHSHGGYSTNYVATQSNRFATYISGAGNSDLVRSYFSYNRNFSTPFYMQFENGQYQMPPFAEHKEMYIKNSPIYDVEKVNAPILLWAGKKDENIFWEQVQEFYVGLKRNHKDVVALFYTKAGHDLGIETEEKEDMHRRAAEWLDYFLKDQKDVAWINRQLKKNENDRFHKKDTDR